jgi:hypothetical protein
MYRILIECNGVTIEDGLAAATDIEKEFVTHRSWWTEPRCQYQEGKLLLSAASDADPNGLALLDEFGDCLVAYYPGVHGEVKILSVQMI